MKRCDATIPIAVAEMEPDELEEDEHMDEPADESILELNNEANARRLDDFLSTSSTFDVAGFGAVSLLSCPLALALSTSTRPNGGFRPPRPLLSDAPGRPSRTPGAPIPVGTCGRPPAAVLPTRPALVSRVAHPNITVVEHLGAQNRGDDGSGYQPR